MFIVDIHRGLGNQLFQYAFGRAAAIRNRATFKMDISSFEGVGANRPYSLNRFKIREDIATKDEIQRTLAFGGGRLLKKLRMRKLWSNLGRRFGFVNLGFVQEDLSRFDSRLLGVREKAYVYGYFGSPAYFDDVWEQLQPDFEFKEEIRGVNKEMAQKLSATESVCMTFRRGGDIVGSPLFDVCGIEYAYAGVEAICQRVRNPHFYIWSDDNKWVEQNVKLERPHTFVTHNHPDFFEDLRLMTYCRHHILPNSTFSWWAAWLRKEKDGIVIAPKRWLNTAVLKEQKYKDFMREWCPRGSMDLSKVYPRDWIQISN